MENEYQDITKTGALNYKDLQQQNEIDFEDINKRLQENKNYSNYILSGGKAQTDLSYYNQTFKSNLYNTNTKFGESMFDPEYVTQDEVESIGDIRAENQPAIVKIAAGLGKGLVLTGTTFVNNTAGLIYGAGKAIHDKDISSLWNNEVTKAMDEINQASEEWMPNYYTQYEQENPFTFNANFIGDKFIKNLGFTLGAYLSGGLYASGIKAIGMGAIKGLRLAGLAKTTHGLKNAIQVNNVVGSFLGSGISAVGEGMIEGLNASNEYLNQNKHYLDSANQQLLTSIEEEYQQNKGKNFIQTDAGIVDEAYLRYQNRIGEAQKAYDDSLKRLSENAKHVGNVTLALNIPLLTAGNLFQFGKIYSGGRRAARGIGKNIKGNFQDVLKGTGKFEASKNMTKGTLKALGNAFSEGTEEISQGIASSTAKGYYTTDLDNFYRSKIDPNAEQQVLSWANTAENAIISGLTDPALLEEGFIGFLTGALGVPGFKVKTKADGTKGRSLTLQGGIYGELRDYRKEMLEERELADRLNNRVQSPDFQNYYQGLIRHYKYDNDMNQAAIDDNTFDYNNAEEAQLISDIIMFDNVGRLGDLQEYLKQQKTDLTDEELQEIVEATTNKETNIGPWIDNNGVSFATTEEGKQKMRESINKNLDKTLDNIKQYQKDKEDIDFMSNYQFNQDALQELTFLKTQGRNWKQRAQDIVNTQLINSIETIATNKESYLMQKGLKSIQQKKEKGKQTLSKEEEETLKEYENLQQLQELVQEIKSEKDLMKVNLVLANTNPLLSNAKKYLPESEYNKFETDLQDVNKLLKGSTKFNQKFEEYINNPTKLEQTIERTKQTVKKEQEKVENDSLSEQLSNAENPQELFTIIQNLNVEPEKLNAVLETLANRGNEVVKQYLKNKKNKKNLIKELDNVLNNVSNENLRQEIKDIANDMSETGATVEEVIDAIKEHVKTQENFQEDEIKNIEEQLDLISQNIESNNLQNEIDNENLGLENIGMDKEVDEDVVSEAENKLLNELEGNKKTTTNPSEKSEPKKEERKEEKKEEKVEPKKENKQEQKEEKTEKEEQKEENSPEVKDSVQKKEEIQQEQTQQKQSNTSTTENWTNAISLYVIRDGELVDFPDAKDKNGKSLEGYRRIWNFLRNNGAFDYVNKGLLKVGDKVKFAIIPSFNETVKREGWFNSERLPIFIIKEDNGENKIVGVLPASNKDLIEHITQNYYDYLSKKKDSNTSENNTIFIDDITSTVNKIYPGIFDYKFDKSGKPIIKIIRKIKNFFVNSGDKEKINVKLGIVSNGTLKSNTTDKEKENVLDLKNPNNKEGQIFLLTKLQNGKYAPVGAVVNKFSIQNERALKTWIDLINGFIKNHGLENVENIYESLYNLIKNVRNKLQDKTISNDEKKEAVKQFKIGLSKYIYLPEGLYFYNTGTDLEIESPDGVKRIIGSENEDFISLVLGKLSDLGLKYQINLKDVESNNSDYVNGILLSDALSSNVDDFNSVNSYFEINPVNKTEEGKFVEDTTRTQNIPNTSNENVSPINGSEKETTVTKTEVEETPKLENNSSQRTEEQKKKSISLLDAINDLDDDQILFRVTTPNKKQESQLSTIEREKRWLEKALPQFSKEDKLKIISGLITVANKGTKAWGMYHKGIITLSDIAANGTLYHEAFHAVFDTSLTEEEKASLLDEARKMYGNKSNRELEEDLAEGFREYMQNQDEKGLLQRIKNFFRDLYYKVTNWKKIYPNIQGYYRMINQGKFKNIDLKKQTNKSTNIIHTPIKDEFKGKLIFAQSGTGKTSIADNIDVIDSDYILASILGVQINQAGDAFNSLKPEQKKEISIQYENAIKDYLSKGKTVITARLNSLKDADVIVYNESVELTNERTSDLARSNNFVNDEYQKESLQKIKEFAKNKKSIALTKNQYLSDIILTNPKFNIKVERLKQFDSIRSLLEFYLKDFGFVIQDLEKNGYSINLLDRTINISKEEDITEATGELISFMSMFNPIEKKLIIDMALKDGVITKEQIFTEKGDINGIAYRKLDKSKYFKVIGKAISEELKYQFKQAKTNNKFDVNVESSTFKDKVNKLRAIIKDFFNKFIDYNINKRLLEYGRTQAINALSLESSFIRKSVFKPGDEKSGFVSKVDLKKALDENPYELDLIKKLSSLGFGLAGSAAISTQGTIYRPSENPLHDIDFNTFNKNKEHLDKVLPTVIDNIQHIRTINGENGIAACETYLTMSVPFTIEQQMDNFSVYSVKDKNTGELIATFVNSNLTILKEGVKGKFLDFFVNNPEARKPVEYDYHGEKLLMGNQKDAFEAKLFKYDHRIKDIWDFNRFIPNDRLQEETSYREEEYTQEMKDILANAPRNKQGQLLAPNGKVSNLTERQYAQVRTKAFKEWFGDWENVNTFITNLDNSRVEIEISSNKNEHEGNKTLKIYIKGQKDKGHFELVKDREFAQYSVHFKTNKDKLQPGDTKILFEELSKAIPDGAIVSTWGSLSEDGIRALPNIGRGMQKIGERTATKKSDNSTINIPIYQKGEGVSKVIDENGEPMVVYHGGSLVNIFDTSGKFGRGAGIKKGDIGAYFTNILHSAKWYEEIHSYKNSDAISDIIDSLKEQGLSEEEITNEWNTSLLSVRSGTRHFFLNIKNPKLTHYILNNDGVYNKKDKNVNENDGQIITRSDTQELEFVAYNPNQIKSATDNIGTFSSENDDIRYREISKEELDRQYELAKKIVKELNNRRYNTKEEAENAFRNSGIPMKFFNGLTQLNANNSVGYKIKLITKDYYNKHLEELMEKPKQYKNPTMYMESIKPTEKYNFYSLDPDIQMELYNDGIDKETFDSFSRDLQEQFLHCL